MKPWPNPLRPTHAYTPIHPNPRLCSKTSTTLSVPQVQAYVRREFTADCSFCFPHEVIGLFRKIFNCQTDRPTDLPTYTPRRPAWVVSGYGRDEKAVRLGGLRRTSGRAPPCTGTRRRRARSAPARSRRGGGPWLPGRGAVWIGGDLPPPCPVGA